VLPWAKWRRQPFDGFARTAAASIFDSARRWFPALPHHIPKK
jgi:hypothetical protein